MSIMSEIGELMDKWQESFRKREDLAALDESLRVASQAYDLNLRDSTLIDVQRALERATEDEIRLRAAVLGGNRARQAT